MSLTSYRAAPPRVEGLSGVFFSRGSFVFVAWCWDERRDAVFGGVVVWCEGMVSVTAGLAAAYSPMS